MVQWLGLATVTAEGLGFHSLGGGGRWRNKSHKPCVTAKREKKNSRMMAKHLSCKSKQCTMLFSLAILDKCRVPASKSPPPETGRLTWGCCNKISTDGMACTADVLFFFPLDISGVWEVQDHDASRLTVSGGQACWLIDGCLFTGMAGGAGG